MLFVLQGEIIHHGPLGHGGCVMLLAKTAEKIRWTHEVETKEGERIQRNQKETREGRTLKKNQL